jgi:hypothetical protein
MNDGGECANTVPRLDLLDTKALYVFRHCQTQWSTDFGERTGLRYSDVRTVAEAAGIEWTEDLLEKIQVCEQVILSQDAARRAAREANQP